MKKLSNERYEVMKTIIEKAQKDGDFKVKIFFAERYGFYNYAGKISKLHGLFKRAYENFKKIGKNEKLEELDKIIFPKKFLNIKEIKKNEKLSEILKERKAHGNWNKLFYNKIDDNLTNYLKKIQEPKYSYKRIKIYN